MTTLKPQLVRADTLDLQDHDAPSAGDHTRQPAHPAPYGFGPAAPHQNQALRSAERDAYVQQRHSPRVSEDRNGGPFPEEPNFYDEPDDEYDSEHADGPTDTNGSHQQDRDMEDGDQGDDDMDDDMLDKISSSPSIDDEDIDFEFVYALHTFVATVEGQANATKGDTMVLLDDSNSYWWLVRVVKDATIGYLPAEHIETPTERLARLNKHRNIDLSATMLGDNPEKSKNPLKKAMKRRNQKTVQFAAPIYYEPSEYDGSDDEEDEGDTSDLVDSASAERTRQAHKDEQAEVAAATAAGAAVAAGSLAIITDTHEPRQLTNGIKRITSDESINSDVQGSPEKMRSTESGLANGDSDTSLNLSRKGNVRNTDSFFKDDSVETKKISLTPRLLRRDSDSNSGSDQQGLKERPSLETFDKMLGADDKGTKDDKKKKEKKGMLRGLFGRKEKAPKGATSDADEPPKVSDESLRPSPQSKDSLESTSSRTESAGPERRPSKLQKAPPNLSSPKNSPVEGRTPFGPLSPQEPPAPLIPAGPAPLPPTSRPAENPPRNQPLSLNTAGSLSRDNRATSPVSSIEKKSMFAPITNVLRSTPSTSHIEDATVSKPAYAKVAKNRFAIDDGDSEDERTPIAEQQNHRSISPLRDSQQMAAPSTDSPVPVSPVETSHEKELAAPRHNPPALMVDTQSDRPTPLVEAPGAFPETPLETPNEDDMQVPGSDRTTSSIKDSPATDIPTPSSSRTTPTWSDASLRSYMDNDQDIRDLLIIVHDKSNVVPAGPDHPYVSTLFVNERSKLAEMQANLDSMLTGWISRKNQTLLSR